MALKVAVVQAAAASGSPTFTQDFTDSVFSSDVRGALFIGSSATTNETASANAQLNFGFAGATGGTTQASVSLRAVDAAATTETHNNVSASLAYNFSRGDSTTDGEFSINSFLSNGVRVDWADQSFGELITCVLLGGDIEARVVSATFTGGAAPDTRTVAHGLGGAPEVILAFCRVAFGTQTSIGAWDGSGYVHFTTYSANAGAVADIYSRVETTGIVAPKATSTPSFTATLTNVGASNFDVQTDTPNSRTIYFLCLRGTSGAIVAKTGVFDTPTSTGDSAVVSGMSAAPQLLLAIPTRQTATGNVTGDDAGAFGLIAAATNTGTQYGGVTASEDDGADPSVSKSQSTNSQALRVLDITGAADIEATVSSWDSGGVTLNFSNINASARKIPYLAFGVAVAAGGGQPKMIRTMAVPGIRLGGQKFGRGF